MPPRAMPYWMQRPAPRRVCAGGCYEGAPCPHPELCPLQQPPAPVAPDADQLDVDEPDADAELDADAEAERLEQMSDEEFLAELNAKVALARSGELPGGLEDAHPAPKDRPLRRKPFSRLQCSVNWLGHRRPPR
jgi:hypothetical protein